MTKNEKKKEQSLASEPYTPFSVAHRANIMIDKEENGRKMTFPSMVADNDAHILFDTGFSSFLE